MRGSARAGRIETTAAHLPDALQRPRMRRSTTGVRWLASAVALGCALGLSMPAARGAGRDLPSLRDADVVERLPARVRMQSATPAEAAATARRWIQEARQTAEPRYLGRAQAALSPWWSRADAPPQLAVLQATIEQSQHHFAEARATLERTLAREPVNAQGWLTLATIERVAGRYDAALAACGRVAQSGAVLYGDACRLETRSLLGHSDEARAGFAALLRDASDGPTLAWLLSLAGENEERAGHDDAALAAYRRSLALDVDDYTALALADLLLRQGRDAEALDALAGRPASDAVQLRRAHAMKRQADPRWRELAQDLRQRFEALAERGDDPALHARESALYWLWIEPDGERAWNDAQANLRLQKEPFDWRLALLSADAANRPQQIGPLVQTLRATGLVDARLARWTDGGAAR